MATEASGLSDAQAKTRNGDSAQDISNDGKKKRKGGPKVKSGCLTCKYDVRSVLQTMD
jgi:hypothetical protein